MLLYIAKAADNDEPLMGVFALSPIAAQNLLGNEMKRQSKVEMYKRWTANGHQKIESGLAENFVEVIKKIYIFTQ